MKKELLSLAGPLFSIKGTAQIISGHNSKQFLTPSQGVSHEALATQYQ